MRLLAQDVPVFLGRKELTFLLVQGNFSHWKVLGCRFYNKKGTEMTNKTISSIGIKQLPLSLTLSFLSSSNQPMCSCHL